MSDFEKLINASDLIGWIMEVYPDWCVGDVRSIVDHVEDMPSAQPERKKGRWLDSQGKEKYVGYCAECSACGGWSEYITDFCPNCGADMRGEDNE